MLSDPQILRFRERDLRAAGGRLPGHPKAVLQPRLRAAAVRLHQQLRPLLKGIAIR